MISSSHLKELLDYDPATGDFIWKPRDPINAKVRSWNTLNAGKLAGSIQPNGRRYIGIGGKVIQASRLAWLYMTGSYPAHRIGHRDGDLANDAFSNLWEKVPMDADARAKMHSVHASLRRARQRNLTPPDADPVAIAAFYDMANRLTRITGVDYHVDHIKPFSKGGLHHQDNLVVMLGSLNRKKYNQHWPWLTWFNR